MTDPLFSVLFPVRNELDSLTVTVPFLNQISEFPIEILIIVDDAEDTSLLLQHNTKVRLDNVRFLVNHNSGVFGAISHGVSMSNGEYLIVCAADELLPLVDFNTFCNRLLEGYDLVSATRYRKGGNRHGGNRWGRTLSRFANWLIFRLMGAKLSDATTGYKGFRKDVWGRISEGGAGLGWSCALKFSLNADKYSLRVSEVPVISVDRAFGGKSTFNLFLWTISYLKVLLYKI